MIIDTKLIERAVFEGTAKAAAERTGLPIRTIQNYRANETSTNYRDWQGISLKTAMETINKLEENKMKKVRIELSGFGGSKRKQLELAVNEALKELNLLEENYFDNDDNAIERFQAHLASESVNDTQAVVVTIGEPNIVQYDYDDAIYSDDEVGEEGGFERVVRHFTIDDLKEPNVHILLTFDI